MFNKHIHQWDEVCRTQQQPSSRLLKARGMDDQTLLDLLYGFTVVEQKCSECGRRTFDRVQGLI